MLPEEQAANSRYFYELASARFGYRESLLEQVQALGIVAEELHGDPHRRADQQLAQVARMRLRGEVGMPLALDIVGAGAEQLQRFIERPVEQGRVIGHIHMAIIVDPLRLDPHDRRDEGREK